MDHVTTPPFHVGVGSDGDGGGSGDDDVECVFSPFFADEKQPDCRGNPTFRNHNNPLRVDRARRAVGRWNWN